MTDIIPFAPGPRSPQAVAVAAERLHAAFVDQRACAPVRELIGPADVAAAYQVQQVVNARRLANGAIVVGRKIGITSQAVQRQLNVDQPDFGVLFADMARRSGDAVALTSLLQPRVEGEVAFMLARDVDEPSMSRRELESAVAYAVAAIEIVDSRIQDWDISLADTIADNASSGLFVLGTEQVPLHEVEPREVELEMWMDDVRVSGGSGQDCLGDPLLALAWLAQTCLEYGAPLRQGEIVLSGALGPLVPVRTGCTVRAEITGLGSVCVDFISGANLGS